MKKYICVQNCPDLRHGENHARCEADEAKILKRNEKYGDFCPHCDTQHIKAKWVELFEF